MQIKQPGRHFDKRFKMQIISKDLLGVMIVNCLVIVCAAPPRMGGHIDHQNNSTHIATNNETEVENVDESLISFNPYNLPDNLFNDGKPFYVERDPVTGVFDFNTKTSLSGGDELLPKGIENGDSQPDYRRDTSSSDRQQEETDGLRTNDITFHDFLNLPVKYTSSKYVYPLISSSYANTKFQGNNNISNHKMYTTSTYSTQKSPHYYTKPASTVAYKNSTIRPIITSPRHPTMVTTLDVTMTSTQHPTKATTQRRTTESTPRPTTTVTASSTKSVSPKSTKKPPSLFEDLFGSDDEYQSYLDTSTNSEVFSSELDNSKINQYQSSSKHTTSHIVQDYHIEKPVQKVNTSAASNSAKDTDGKKYGDTIYEYDYNVKYSTEAGPHNKNLHNGTIIREKQNTTDAIKSVVTRPPFILKWDGKNDIGNASVSEVVQQEVNKYDVQTLQSPISSTNSFNQKLDLKITPSLVTSMPLDTVNSIGHIGSNSISQASHMYAPKHENGGDDYVQFHFQSPSSNIRLDNKQSTGSNVVVPPDQNSVSFIVRNHQSVDSGLFVGSAVRESPYDRTAAHLRPPHHSEQDQLLPAVEKISSLTSNRGNNNLRPIDSPHHAPDEETFFQKGGNDVIQQNNKIVIPGNSNGSHGVQIYPHQLIAYRPFLNDDIDLVPPSLPSNMQTSFSNNFKTEQTETTAPLREVLHLNGQPLFHQLPKDLTPPAEEVLSRPYFDRMENNYLRPPWDPRPGHFHMGKPEFALPTKPVKLQELGPHLLGQDSLPNILPQFRPNAKSSHGHSENQSPMLHVQQPPGQSLYDRISNRPPYDTYENVYDKPLQPQRRVHLQIDGSEGHTDRITTKRRLPKPIEMDYAQSESGHIHQAYKSKNSDRFHMRQSPMSNPSYPYAYERMSEYMNKKILNDNTRHDVNISPNENQQQQDEYSSFYEKTSPVSPPSVSNRRNGEASGASDTVVTLQMIHSKQVSKEIIDPMLKPIMPPPFKVNYPKSPSVVEKQRNTSPVYVVYPVSSSPIKPDIINTVTNAGVLTTILKEHTRKDSLKINNLESKDYTNTPFTITHPVQKPILMVRNKTETSKSPVNIRSDFPYQLEYPAGTGKKYVYESKFYPEQPDSKRTELPLAEHIWDPEDETYVKSKGELYNYLYMDPTTETPIAIAYTPTAIPSLDKIDEPHEIKQYPSALPQHTLDEATKNMEFINRHRQDVSKEEFVAEDSTHNNFDFQAPFQASMSLGTTSIHERWSAVATNKSEDSIDKSEPVVSNASGEPTSTDANFAFENFKPQLFGGFKPIYNTPLQNSTELMVQTPDRSERALSRTKGTALT